MTKPLPMEKRYPWAPTFLAALRNSGNVRAACELVKVPRSLVYAAKLRSPEFQAAWDEAVDEAVELLEAVALKRAMAGSDLLLIFLLKAHKPEMYRETVRQEVSGVGGGPIDHRVEALVITPDMLREALQALMQAQVLDSQGQLLLPAAVVVDDN